MTKRTTQELNLMANDMRHDIIRMLEAGKSGHPGGSLSVIDILTTIWFGGVMTYDEPTPKSEGRDMFVLSKGHAAPALYAVFHKLGWLEDADMSTLRQLGSKLQGHPDAHMCPGVEVCSGSLGQGLSISSGIARGFLWDHEQDPTSRLRRVYCVCGDGELQEGSNWEALMFAAHQKLYNLTMVLDLNNLQIDGFVSDVNSLGDVNAKLTSFGWHVIEVNGHDIDALRAAFAEAEAYTQAPVALVASTIKGKGVSFMENQAGWHGKAPNKEQADAAIAELDAQAQDLVKEA